ncbi:DnaJ domain-containing protein [Flectobacillus rivi]|uniref:DnaJ domain-containing protein n=1 Tax=Flectobacillus rivi TaxID=2984209 RepID=A0ABT6YZ38_9BACT|nr:DnaJ domain-containing protein [Flectobacillus rivi]MDI9874049.1 DnaJ domain-containing protein [Flectobacillus rivi]
MFKDYYAILEIEENAIHEEVKSAFKKQALKWHPDRNIGLDTTIQMQEINEAYLILKDSEARYRYNREYMRFKEFQQKRDEQQKNNYEEKFREKYKGDGTHTNNSSDHYKVYDEILNNWMNNAKQQAIDLAKQTIEDLKGMTSVGVRAVAKEAKNQFIYQIIGGLLLFFIFMITKSCNN